ncbi:HK97 family phage prohead protease [Cupriavidus necator]
MARRFVAIISSGSYDRAQDRIDVTKATWGKVVPIQLSHKTDSVIGKALIITQEGDKLKAVGEIFDAGKSAVADHAWAGLESGALVGLSIGFRPLEVPTPNTRGGLDYGRIELTEFSVLPNPCNPDAVILEVKDTGEAPAKTTTKPSASAWTPSAIAAKQKLLAHEAAEREAHARRVLTLLQSV